MLSHFLNLVYVSSVTETMTYLIDQFWKVSWNFSASAKKEI